MMNYKIEIDNKSGISDELSKFLRETEAAWIEHAKDVSEKLKIELSTAFDVIYLRGRSRWTQELEDELIRLHREGNPPNVMEFQKER